MSPQSLLWVKFCCAKNSSKKCQPLRKKMWSCFCFARRKGCFGRPSASKLSRWGAPLFRAPRGSRAGVQTRISSTDSGLFHCAREHRWRTRAPHILGGGTDAARCPLSSEARKAAARAPRSAALPATAAALDNSYFWAGSALRAPARRAFAGPGVARFARGGHKFGRLGRRPSHSDKRLPALLTKHRETRNT